MNDFEKEALKINALTLTKAYCLTDDTPEQFQALLARLSQQDRERRVERR